MLLSPPPLFKGHMRLDCFILVKQYSEVVKAPDSEAVKFILHFPFENILIFPRVIVETIALKLEGNSEIGSYVYGVILVI